MKETASVTWRTEEHSYREYQYKNIEIVLFRDEERYFNVIIYSQDTWGKREIVRAATKPLGGMIVDIKEALVRNALNIVRSQKYCTQETVDALVSAVIKQHGSGIQTGKMEVE